MVCLFLFCFYQLKLKKGNNILNLSIEKRRRVGRSGVAMAEFLNVIID
jgi:hypothetical protein